MGHCLDAITISAIGVAKDHETEIFEITTLMVHECNLSEEGYRRTHQVCAHVHLQPDLVDQGHLLLPKGDSLAGPAHHLLVAPPLEPVWQESLHHLVEDLAGDQQRGQTLWRSIRRKPTIQH